MTESDMGTVSHRTSSGSLIKEHLGCVGAHRARWATRDAALVATVFWFSDGRTAVHILSLLGSRLHSDRDELLARKTRNPFSSEMSDCPQYGKWL